MAAPFRVEPLNEAHDRGTFTCGEQALDAYFQRQVTQDVRRHITNCFVAVDTASGQLAGYYTLAATSIPLANLPEVLAKRLPRYPLVPAVRIGRLAIDMHFQGRGLGAALLANAAQRTLDAGPAAYASVVDAKHDSAVAFYRHHGFISFGDDPFTLFLPIATYSKSLPTANR